MDRERERKLLERLDRDGYIKVSELGKELHCTEVTLRRDLKKLDERGLLKRVHGGAVKIGNNFVHNSVKEALYQKLYEKMEIAKTAYDYIQDKETIMIDDASTCIHLSSLIANTPDKYIKIITNSIILAEKLLDFNHVELLMIGGNIDRNLGATEGDEAFAQLGKVCADKAFIGVNGLDFESGITLTGYPQQAIKKRMMESSAKTFILADSSKFNKVYMSYLCGMDAPAAIITDHNVSPAILEQAKEKQISIITKYSKSKRTS